MGEHAIEVRWERGAKAFDYASYGRDHDWRLEGGGMLRASAAAEYRGSAGLLNPETALVGALASCHMLSFLALAARQGWVIESYRDHAVGVLEKNERGQLAVTRVELRPAVVYGQPAPGAEERERLHTGAHRGCFIANSVLTEVSVQPQDVG